ncbi:26331_t:CDS:2 [Gigaspora margarita]|uniref:26331_t:CDS:1 n=1 Tax=Gigaspora margarita TaxID=4874 RepID=A0ABM8W4K7_GIGMA|nr:26331_t:CDS:2 [Gigaspora margarita]
MPMSSKLLMMGEAADGRMNDSENRHENEISDSGFGDKNEKSIGSKGTFPNQPRTLNGMLKVELDLGMHCEE